MTENEQYRVPTRIAELPSDHTIPNDIEDAYHGARIGLVREHAALGCKGCQHALNAYNEHLTNNPISIPDRAKPVPSKTKEAVADGGGNHSITDYTRGDQ